jgi:AMMECR1 domain-containing protein
MNYLSLVALYSLFHVKIQEELIRRAAQDVSSVSEKPFGAFVTLTRGPESAVHGCVGNWSPDFQEVPSSEIVNWVQQLAQDARHRDQRRFHFSKDVNEDVSTTLTISVMLLPLYTVNTYTGFLRNGTKGEETLFRNEEYGLIFQGKSGQRATYLPEVYVNETWENVSKSLLQKAGLTSREQGTFYAYKTLTVEVDVYSLLFSVRGTYFIEREVAAFYDKYFEDFVPYEFDSKRGQVVIDKSQAVRSVATLVDVLHLSQKFTSVLSWGDKPVLQNSDYYFEKWYSYGQDYTQASIFLLQAYTFLFHKGVDVQKRVALLEDSLYNALLTLEPQFEMGEAVSTLAPLVNAATPFDYVEKLFKACTLMRSRLETFRVSRIRRRITQQLDLVFELNWQSQSAHKMLHLVLSQFPEHVPFFQAFVSELSEMMLSVLGNNLPHMLETNYLVVVYECLCHLEAAFLLGGDPVPVSLKEQKLFFYTTLLEARRGPMGLFYFRNSTVARLDLTGHMLLINL